MDSLVIILFCIWSTLDFLAAEMSGAPSSFAPATGPAASSSANRLLTNIYPPRTAAFSENLREAQRFSNEDWQNLSLLQRANYIRDVYVALVEAHGYTYSPRILLCKSYLESTFEPQIKNKNSSASGLAQVLTGTAHDTLLRGRWRSVVPGFEGIESGETYFERMKGNMIAQMDLGLGVLRQKERDTGQSAIRNILAAYYGSSNQQANQAYADRIYDCATCIRDTEDQEITQACLDIVKR